ncbi:hypothetical protein RR47_GL002001 [Enterococcus columbae DSM 7374 = ATCC 51263]|nr:hypothetical protein RR47_GL002001 [Enterococcus columbae DSM 7374 = ATCC 51263]
MIFAEENHSDMNTNVISEMMESQVKVEEMIDDASQKEKLYSYEEILKIPDNEFPNAKPSEVALIKVMIKNALEQGNSNLLDDSGWGPKNFITSDCNMAISVVAQCVYESIIKKLNGVNVVQI